MMRAHRVRVKFTEFCASCNLFSLKTLLSLDFKERGIFDKNHLKRHIDNCATVYIELLRLFNCDTLCLSVSLSILTHCVYRTTNTWWIQIAVVILIKQYSKERGLCGRHYLFITLLSEIKLPHNSSRHYFWRIVNWLTICTDCTDRTNCWYILSIKQALYPTTHCADE